MRRQTPLSQPAVSKVLALLGLLLVITFDGASGALNGPTCSEWAQLTAHATTQRTENTPTQPMMHCCSSVSSSADELELCRTGTTVVLLPPSAALARFTAAVWLLPECCGSSSVQEKKVTSKASLGKASAETAAQKSAAATAARMPARLRTSPAGHSLGTVPAAG